MTKGIIYLAPGQRYDVKNDIEKRDFHVVIDANLGVDCSFGTPVGKSVLWEFKHVPDDLVSSIRNSARMSRQAITLGANEGPSIFLMIGFPEFRWITVTDRHGNRHAEYVLVDPNNKAHPSTGVTFGELMDRMLTMAMIGIFPLFVPHWDVVAETVCEYYAQFQKKEHHSHLIRPSFAGGNIMESWPKPNAGDLITHIFEGFEGMGHKKGNDAWQYFGDFRTFAIAGEDYYKKIPGIGRVTAKKLEQQMTANWKDFHK